MLWGSRGGHARELGGGNNDICPTRMDEEMVKGTVSRWRAEQEGCVCVFQRIRGGEEEDSHGRRAAAVCVQKHRRAMLLLVALRAQAAPGWLWVRAGGRRQASVTGAGVHGLLVFPRRKRGLGGSSDYLITADKRQEVRVLGRRRCCLAAEL